MSEEMEYLPFGEEPAEDESYLQGVPEWEVALLQAVLASPSERSRMEVSEPLTSFRRSRR